MVRPAPSANFATASSVGTNQVAPSKVAVSLPSEAYGSKARLALNTAGIAIDPNMPCTISTQEGAHSVMFMWPSLRTGAASAATPSAATASWRSAFIVFVGIVGAEVGGSEADGLGVVGFC